MAWIEPVMDRKNAKTRTTCDDFNRICGNANIAFSLDLKEDWTVDDIVDIDTWTTLISKCQMLDETITDSTRFDNLNKIEKAINDAVYSEHLYPSDMLYPGNEAYPA